LFYLIAADITAFFHFIWIVFLIAGSFIGRRYKWVKRLHMAGIAFALFIQLVGWYCPLTHLETWLRRMHDPSNSYAGSFIINYLEKIIYISLPPYVLLLLTIVLIIMSALVYVYRSGK
jgi:hypothetical protein